MREIIVGQCNKQYKSNSWSRNEHNLLVLPVYSILNYFKNVENLYFLFIGVFQLLTFTKIGILPEYWSPTGPFSTIIPLLLCLFLDIGTDIFYWFNIFLDDYRKNRQTFRLWNYNMNRWIEKTNQNIYPGEIIALEKNTIVPMDVLLIDHFSNNKNDYCKISLANLNGESYPVIVDKLVPQLSLDDFRMSKIKISHDNKQSLSDLEGEIVLRNGNRSEICHRSLLVNGSYLLSDGCLAIVINCGTDSKLQDKRSPRTNKQNTTMEQISNFMMNTTIYILILLVLIIDAYKLWLNQLISWYSFFYFLLLRSIQSWIVLNGIIPFSIKILLSFLRNMECRQLKGIRIISPYLVDQISHINYILSDKTGTITKNKLELMKMIDSTGEIYHLDKDSSRMMPRLLVRALGLCIGINDGEYQTPEDKTIHQKYLYLRSKILYVENQVQLDIYGNIEDYIRYPVEGLNFNLLRPISSQIFINKLNGEYSIFTKASIGKLMECLKDDDKEKLLNIDNKITEIDSSLRLLALGWKSISREEIQHYESLSQTEKLLEVEKFESQLELIGILGIQDSLIDNIDKSIDWILDNGIGFGLLTGDRKITAIAIAKNAGIIKDNSLVISLDNIDILRQIYLTSYKHVEQPTCFIFNNRFIQSLLENREAQSIWLELLSLKPSLIGYSLTPNGKKSILDLVEISGNRTLAIGDGLNDIKMLSSANIGISLSPNIDSYADISMDNFNDLVRYIQWGYNFSMRNQIVALMTMFKSCSLGFLLFWILLLTDGNICLFDFFVHQGFHLAWCIIHPYIYCVYSFPKNTSINRNTFKILNNWSMLSWILLAGFESSLIANIMIGQFKSSKCVSLMVFYLIIQINSMLLMFDISYSTLFIQIINFCIFLIYIQMGNIGIFNFALEIWNHFSIHYVAFILVFHGFIIYIWRRYLKI